MVELLPQACAPLAQLDRASDYESEGREFESLRARHPQIISHSRIVQAASDFRASRIFSAEFPCFLTKSSNRSGLTPRASVQYFTSKSSLKLMRLRSCAPRLVLSSGIICLLF